MDETNFAAQIEQIRQQQMMVGQEPIPEFSGDPKTYIQLLAATHQDIAGSLAASMGAELPTLMQEASSAGYYEGDPMGGLLGKTLGFVGENIEPITKAAFLAPLALGAIGGAFGGGAAAGGGSSAAAVPAASSAAPVAGAWNPALMGGASSTAGMGAGAAWSPTMMGGASGGAGLSTATGTGVAGAAHAGAAGAGAGALSNIPPWVAPVVGGLVGASGSSSPQTSTSTSEPPAYLQPYLKEAVGAASNLYRAGGTPIPPWSPQTQQAADRIEQRATAGSPVNTAAQNYATQTLSGGFMGSNPWLDRTFNQAAGAVTNQVQSNFGLSGRNPRGVDAAGFAADQYNNLATQIYGGDYQAERARQQQMVPYAGQLANQDYVDLDALTNVGGMYDDRARELAGQPGRNLDQYLGRLGMYPGGTQTTTVPTDRNRLAGALGGAMLAQNMFGGQYGWGGA